jgi:hypothetical protein
MPWYKFEKIISRGHRNVQTDYMYIHSEVELKEIRELCENWAERISGGHTYGYEYQWTAEDPPLEWIQKRINEKEALLKDVQKSLDFLRACEVLSSF